MIRDIGVTSINKGQFPIAIIGAIIIILVLKMPSDDTSKLVFKVFSHFTTMHFLGWGISFISILGWYFSNRYQRRIHHQEMTRIAEEKKKLQEQKISKKLPSSNSNNLNN
ncbi:MAG: hypothetical protein RLZZ628_2722 [Bacteroidota bacterium]